MLGSGKGSNFVAIAEAIQRGEVPAEVAIVLSDVESAGILQHAVGWQTMNLLLLPWLGLAALSIAWISMSKLQAARA